MVEQLYTGSVAPQLAARWAIVIRLAAIAALACLGACAGQPDTAPAVTESRPQAFTDYADFGPRPDILPQDAIFALSDSQRDEFLAYFKSWKHREVEPHRRITNYLQRFGKAFNYQGDTFTAEQTMRLQSGNCMSMAVLTTALANIAGIEVGYQLVDSIPVYEIENNIAFKGQHVRSYLYDPGYVPDGSGFTIIRRPGIIVDYFPSGREHFIGNISEQEYVAMFYRNKAASALAGNDFNTAFWLLQESMIHAPENPDAINTLAILHRRIGDNARAEALYRHGIGIAEEKVSLIKNYRNMLRSLGREEEAAILEQQLHTLYDPSPFSWLSLAREAFDREDYILSVRMYDKALELAPYLQEAHLGKVQAQLNQGQLSAAVKSLDAATEYMYQPEEKALYTAKLSTLKHRLYQDN